MKVNKLRRRGWCFSWILLIFHWTWYDHVSRYDHQWTFPRQFHVSPFNDRSGHYMCQIAAPSHPPSALEDSSFSPPRPVVKITLFTTTPHPEKKLVAIIRATHSAPLSSTNLLSTLLRAPFALLLSFPRIVYQAYLLHYYKRLDVYQRPEPCASDPAVEPYLPPVLNAVQTDVRHVGRGVGWQRKGPLERWCEQRVYAFLYQQCEETNISVYFIPANPVEKRTIVHPSGRNILNSSRTLTIYYRSPRVFTIFFTTPSPRHAILLGVQGDRIFSVSSEELFNEAFATPTSALPRQPWSRLTQYVRRLLVTDSIDLSIPPFHALDSPMTFMTVFVLLMLSVLTMVEKKALSAIGARFVRGDEPWGGWTRLRSDSLSLSCPREKLGSVRREEGR